MEELNDGAFEKLMTPDSINSQELMFKVNMEMLNVSWSILEEFWEVLKELQSLAGCSIKIWNLNSSNDILYQTIQFEFKKY